MLRRDRRSIRLPGFDYARPGAYFVTFCTAGRAPLFGAIVGGRMRLSPLGRIAADEWARTPGVRPYVRPDAFMIMPDHVHGIIVIGRRGGRRPHGAGSAGPPGPAAGSVGAIVGQFKSLVTKRINALRGTPGAAVWQRGYHEHVIRDAAALNRIRRYIADNPARWGATRVGNGP